MQRVVVMTADNELREDAAAQLTQLRIGCERIKGATVNAPIEGGGAQTAKELLQAPSTGTRDATRSTISRRPSEYS